MNFRRLIAFASFALVSCLALADTFTLPCAQPYNGTNYGSGQVVVTYTYGANGNLSYSAQYQSCTTPPIDAYTGTVTANGTLLPAANGAWAINLTSQVNLKTDRNASEVCTMTQNGTFTPATSQTSDNGKFNGKISINNCDITVTSQPQVFSGPNAILNYLFLTNFVPTE